MRAAPATLAAVSTIGCIGPLVPVALIDELPLEQRRAILSMPIYNADQLADRTYSILAIAEGLSCKNKTWDPAATKTDAIRQVKYWAYETGADAIMNVDCDSPRGTSTSYNCWDSVSCTAQATSVSPLE